MTNDENWDLKEGEVLSHSGKIKLRTYEYRKKNAPNPATALFILHGFSGHFGNYRDFPKFLESSVDVIYGFDLQGHGKSGGKRGYVKRFDEYAEDVIHVIKSVVKEQRVHLLGHSMGGLVLLRVLSLNSLPVLALTSDLKFSSLILSAPGIAFRVHISLFVRFFARLLSGFLPSAQFSIQFNPAHVTHDAENRIHLKTDPLYHGRITPALYYGMLEAQKEVLKEPFKTSIPVKFLLPASDRTCNYRTTMRFFANLDCLDKEISTYRNFFHSTFSEVGREAVFDEVNNWIKRHSS